MSGSFLPAINAAGHSTSFPGDPPLSTDANEDEAILQQAGLNPLQAQDIVELLREQNLDVMGMVRWKHEQLDAFWNEAFPRMEPAKLASVMKQLHILLHQKCGTVMTAPNPYRYSAPAREAAAQATPSYLWFVKGNPDITAALDHYNFSMDTWTDVEKEAGDLLTYEMRQNKTQMLKNQNLYERSALGHRAQGGWTTWAGEVGTREVLEWPYTVGVLPFPWTPPPPDQSDHGGKTNFTTGKIWLGHF